MDKRNQGRCPKCGRELLEFTYQGIRIDQCSNCDGIWLDPGELELVKRARKGLLLSHELIGKWVWAKEREDTLSQDELEELKSLAPHLCPRCSSAMEEMQEHGVHVDRCTQCRGTWLDGGEIEAVAGTEHGVLAKLHTFLHG